MAKIATRATESPAGLSERDGVGAVITGKNLTLKSVADLLESKARLALDPEALEAVIRSRAIVEKRATGETALYGINTGFGVLAHERIPAKDLQRLQQNLILSHAVGAGDEVPAEIVALMLLLKANGLAVGLSGVRPVIIDYLIRFYNEGIYPIVYTKGSLGASGDLAPLAHLTLPLIGLGEVYRGQARMPAGQALKELGLAPLQLEAKEGLALINGTQFMAAFAVHCLLRLQRLLVTADVVAAMTLESIRGSAAPFDARIHEARPHPGQKKVAARMRQLVRGSQTLPSHIDCPKVQDPYAIRCVPQVHGAAWESFEHGRQVIERELNSATDNPLVFDDGDIVSGGNFHGELLAFLLDYLAIATAEIASISERRLFLLLGGDTLGDIKLPKLLMKDTGLNSGFMLPQYLAAALVSENKVLAHPASVDSIHSSLRPG